MKPHSLQLEISGPIAPCLRRARRGRQVWARPDGIRRSADLQSAVSRICNPQRSRRFEEAGLPDTLPNAIRRYSRLKICATAKRHSYVDAFHRRLEQGRCCPSPIGWERVPETGEGGGLGWKEFVPDYVGPFCDGTAPCATENHVIPAFLEMMFDRSQNGIN